MALTLRYQKFTLYDSEGYTGNIYYVRFVNKTTSYVWDAVAGAMAVSPVWGDSAVMLSDVDNPGAFPVFVPAGLPSANYDIVVYKQAGSAPDITDDIENQYTLKQGDIFGF